MGEMGLQFIFPLLIKKKMRMRPCVIFILERSWY